MKALSGTKALVIGGGGGGIGRAITRGLAHAGSAVAVADADKQHAEEAAAEIAATGAASISLVGDVRSRADIDGFVRRAAQELGGLDILVTVVGGQLAFVPAARLHEMRDEDWQLMFDLNLHYVARAVQPGRHSHERRYLRPDCHARRSRGPGERCAGLDSDGASG